MFRRMTPPKPKGVDRSGSSTNTGGVSEYSESSPELENAIMNKNWSLVRKYVPQGVGMARKHLLHKAVRAGAPVELIQLMVEHGCNVDETQEGNWTPLHVATKHEAAPAVIEYLIKAGAHVNIMTSTGESPLFFAAERDVEAVVDILINAGADVNQARSTDGMTPLIVILHNYSASTENPSWILQLLLKAKADINQASNDGSTPLLIAAQKGCSDAIIEALLKAGADVNCATKKSGETPLLSLVQRNSPPSKVALLLQAGADVNRPNLLGETAVMVGAQNRVSAPLMELLLRAGGHVNQPSSGASADLVKLMLQYGADISSHRFQRKSALELAEERGFMHLTGLLDPNNKVESLHFEKLDAPFKFCGMCRTSEKALVPCQTCNVVAYCSGECRARHWKVGGHKEVCTAVLSRLDDDEDEE